METRKIYILLIIGILSINVFSQGTRNKINMYKENVHKFYDILYGKTSIKFSSFYGGPGTIKNEELKNSYSELTFNVSYDSINKIINKLQVDDEGYGYSEYSILNFGNNKKIFFLITVDSLIGRIWLSNGDELYYKINYKDVGTESLLWNGIIDTKSNNYIDLHEQPDINSRVMKRLSPNQIFKYCPIGGDWFPVYENGKWFLGYIQKKFIIMYQDFPEELKAKARLNGC